MADIQRIDDLEIEQDEDYQRREWRFERVGRWVMLLLILLAVGGVFGKGALSSTVAANETLALRYERFLRWDTPSQLELTLRKPTGAELVEAFLSGGYASRVRITEISPQPIDVRSDERGFTYRFRLTDGGRIHFSITPLEPGLFRLRVAADAGPELAVWQYAWP